MGLLLVGSCRVASPEIMTRVRAFTSTRTLWQDEAKKEELKKEEEAKEETKDEAALEEEAPVRLALTSPFLALPFSELLIE